MASPYLLLIRGTYVIVGKEPDGDSVRFVADDPTLYDRLKNSHRIRLSSDGSVQLRFEAVDAPELHYGKEAQPLGMEARDHLLEWMGFREIVYHPGSTMVGSAEPSQVAGAILSAAAEANGRPVAYVLLEADVPATDGSWVDVDQQLLDTTMNHRLLAEGRAYYTVYTSTPAAHRVHLRTVAAAARSQGMGVWAQDSSAEWVLDDQASLAPGGQLILPKLFRRCTDYLKAVKKGFIGELAEWVRSTDGSTRSENDGVVLHGSTELHLADLLAQRNHRIAFQADLLDIVFIEK